MVLKGRVPHRNIEKRPTYIPDMYVEPFSLLRCGKEPLRTFRFEMYESHVPQILLVLLPQMLVLRCCHYDWFFICSKSKHI